jgi:hypothetical protein
MLPLAAAFAGWIPIKAIRAIADPVAIILRYFAFTVAFLSVESVSTY